MIEYILNNIGMLLSSELLHGFGFLGTRALFLMDVGVLFLALLPILLGLSILTAINGQYRLHKFTQSILFFLTLFFLALFAYVVHYQQGFDSLMSSSSINSNQAFYFLVLHVIVAMTTMVMWFIALLYAKADRKRRALPGVYSQSHRKTGWRICLGICLVSLTSVGLYWILFVA